MIYAWELILKALSQDIEEKEIRFRVTGGSIAPHLEMLLSSFIYQERFPAYLFSETEIDINPYVRFSDIFFEWLPPEKNLYPEFNKALADIVVHYLAHLDLRSGMTRREYYIKFMEKDIENGLFGDRSGKVFASLNRAQKKRVATEILNLYKTNDYMSCLRRVSDLVLPYMQILDRSGKEIIFWCRERENKETVEKIMFIIKLFLPLNIRREIHWEYTYGEIGKSKSMKLEQFVLR